MAEPGNRNPSDRLAELPPLYKRINWTALLVPPAGIILLVLMAIYLYPYMMKKARGNQFVKRSKANCEEIPQDNWTEMNKLGNDDLDGSLTLSSSDDCNYVWINEKPQSTPTHLQVERITPTPSPKLGRLSLSPGPPLVSEENLLF